MLTLLFLSTLIFPQDNFHGWSSITSLLNPTGMIVSEDGAIYSSTSGGLLKFNPYTEKFNFIKEEEGLIYLDLSSISIDENQRIWLGGSYPNGYIQIFDPFKGVITKITHLEVTQINKIIIGTDKAYAVYQGSKNTEIGILEFLFDDLELPYYKDYYTNFTDSLISDITDLDIKDNYLYISTNIGVYRGDINLNLKNPLSWNKIYDENAIQFVSGNKEYVLDEDSIIYSDGSNWIRDEINFDGRVIDAIYKNEILCVLTEFSYYEIINGTVSYSFSLPDISSSKTYFTSFILADNSIYLGLKDGGLLQLDRLNNSFFIYIPDTPFQNEYSALLVTDDGKLVAASKYGTLIDYGERYHNFIPWEKTINIPYKNLVSNDRSFSWDYLTYGPGEHQPISIIEQKNKNIIFANSGTIPNDTSWLSYPAIIDLDIKAKTFSSIDTVNSIIDGLWGIIEDQIFSSYMVINQISRDNLNNIWITNPYSEKNGNIIAIKNINGIDWSHLNIPDSYSYIPTSIGFDRLQNAWIGFEYEMNGNIIYSNGGLKIFQYSDINFTKIEDSTWLTLSNPEVLPGESETASVWSIAFDEMDFVWILNENGVRGYSYLINNYQITLDPILKSIDGVAIDFLPQISFVKGNKIKIDSQNNKWISTNQGVWVIQESLLYWPSEDGFNVENSALLSDNVHDITFNNDNGVAYIATDKGISKVQIPFSEKPTKEEKMYISPNPFIIQDDAMVVIKNIAPGSFIKIMTITGIVVKEVQLNPSESQYLWNGEDRSGNMVGTAVYIVSAHHSSQPNMVSKIAVIRK